MKKRRHSAATKAKISRALRGKKRKLTDEERVNLSNQTRDNYFSGKAKGYIAKEDIFQGGIFKDFGDGSYGRKPLTEVKSEQLKGSRQKFYNKLDDSEKRELSAIGYTIAPLKIGKTPKGFKEISRVRIISPGVKGGLISRELKHERTGYKINDNYPTRYSKNMNNLEFGRGKDKKKRKSRGFGSRFNNKRNQVAEGLGTSALKSNLNRARKGKFTPGIGNKTKSFLSNKIAADKNKVQSKLKKKGEDMAENEYKTASRQARQLNKGRALQKEDRPAAGLLYDRTRGKYISAKMRVK